MTIEIISIILAVSLASERLIEILKTWIPWLATQKSQTDDNAEGVTQEKIRRTVIQLISVLCGVITALVLANEAGKDFTLIYSYDDDGNPSTEKAKISIFVLGILSSAGSVFWTQILGYAKAVKDVKKQEAQADRIEVDEMKQNKGLPTSLTERDKKTVLAFQTQKAPSNLKNIPTQI